MNIQGFVKLLSIFLILFNVLFGSIYMEGFYYFYKILMALSGAILLLPLIPMVICKIKSYRELVKMKKEKANKKDKEDSEYYVNLIKIGVENRNELPAKMQEINELNNLSGILYSILQEVKNKDMKPEEIKQLIYKAIEESIKK